MIFLYKGWAFLDSPATTAVFSIILLSTRPSNVLRLRLFIDQPHTIPDSVNNPASDTLCTTKSDMHIYLPQRSSYPFQLGLGSRQFSLPQFSLDSGNLLFHISNFSMIGELFRSQPKPKVKQLSLCLLQSPCQIIVTESTHFLCLHPAPLPTNLVSMGSLFDARRIASLAASSFTPPISKIILPGLTTATQ